MYGYLAGLNSIQKSVIHRISHGISTLVFLPNLGGNVAIKSNVDGLAHLVPPCTSVPKIPKLSGGCGIRRSGGVLN